MSEPTDKIVVVDHYAYGDIAENPERVPNTPITTTVDTSASTEVGDKGLGQEGNQSESEQPTIRVSIPKDTEDDTVDTEWDDGDILVGDDDLLGKFSKEDDAWYPNHTSPAPFDYGYKEVQMTADNCEFDPKGLYIKRPIRSSDMTFQIVAGSVRSMNDAHRKSPSEFFFSETNPVGTSPKRAYWKAMSWMAITQYNPSYDMYRILTNDIKRRWRDGWPMPNGKHRGMRFRPGTFATAKSSSKSAAAVINAALNLGKDIDLFLPHSGLSVMLRHPTLSQFIETERKIIGDRLALFRDPRGLLMSQDSAYIQQAIFDLFLACVESTSAGRIDVDFLRENITILDLADIAWALSTAKFPNGFAASIPCFANPGRCNATQNEIVDPRKMYKVDVSALNEFQMGLATRTSGQTSQEELDKYMDSFDYGEAGHVDIRTYDTDLKVRIYFGLPSVGHMFRCAEAWRHMLETAANESFARPLVGDERERYMRDQLIAMGALRYEPYVSEISIIDEFGQEERIDDTENIRKTLIGISENPYQLSDFLVGVEKFINKATISIVGFPNVKCPACGGYHEAKDESGVGHHIVPIDVFSFFTILCQQLIDSSPSSQEETETAQTTMNDSSNQATS